MLEEEGHLLAADAVMTNDHGFALAVELVQAGHDVSHRQQATTVEPADIKLPRLAHVEQQGLLPGLQGAGVVRARGLLTSVGVRRDSELEMLCLGNILKRRNAGLEQDLAMELLGCDPSHDHCLHQRRLSNDGE